MSSKEEHQALGVIIGVVGYLNYKNVMKEPWTPEGMVGSALAGGFIASLPDEIEPPTHPKHRTFFHSGSVLALVVAATSAISRNPNLTPIQKHAYLTALAAYGGHLVQDSTTPTGLPSI